MIIYLFDEENIHSVSISTRLTGMYPIDFNDKVIANIYCENNNVKLIRIPYWEFNNIENI